MEHQSVCSAEILCELDNETVNMQSCISDIAVGVILDKWSCKFCFRNCYAFVSMTSITMVEGQYG
ncbi:hypothetical protein T12_14794 [Trichinella patagoniensis]|uniref:Uncharacterized protein n=1 Tax=Trichinella patagoniensis TaxID=990121 RepID=A0A0V0ZE31_9BILA|nr:hypothetical protein T12_14794 [Trichinella patagoniensis]